LTFLGVVIVLFFGIAVFFQISEIRVEGETRYSSEEIQEASGVRRGDHMFSINATTIFRNIQGQLPYVEEVSVQRIFPSRLEITVRDGIPLAFIRTGQGNLLLERRCRVLEICTGPPMSGLIEIEGLDPILPREGEVIALGEAGSGKVAYLQNLFALLEEMGMLHDVETIELANANDLRLHYAGRFIVLLGQNRDLDYKLAMLLGTVERLGAYEMGVIDLAQGGPAHFRPS